MAVSETIAGTCARPKLDSRPGVASSVVFTVLLAGGVLYAAQGFLSDIRSVHESLALGAFALLGLALLIALGFEFVNGFQPNSSSHALIGSITGVGLANQLMAPASQRTAGVDWSQALNVGEALLFSPLIGFALAGLLLLIMKSIIRSPSLYQEPKDARPPPWWFRATLIFTCTCVSFAHGGNDGQKGMGLIMLILIGVAPTAYALNRTMPDLAMPGFVESARAAEAVFAAHAGGATPVPADRARAIVGAALRTRDLNRPQVYAGLEALSKDITPRYRTTAPCVVSPRAPRPTCAATCTLPRTRYGSFRKSARYSPTAKRQVSRLTRRISNPGRASFPVG